MSSPVLVTGSSGLVGSECVRHFDRLGRRVHGVDNNGRMYWFGPDGDTRDNLRRLTHDTSKFHHHAVDIRDRGAVFTLFAEVMPKVVIHCAAQPSHDLATRRPLDDFEVNALGTLNLLEATRQIVPEATFVFASTNKVYGDTPNLCPLVELETRFDFAWPSQGFAESLSIDQSRHSIFGASKAAADLLVQEYARTFGLKTGCFRMGCITGASHAAAELHGFLAYLVRCVKEGRPYTVYGHKGKQVRDQLHAADVAAAFAEFAAAPRPGEVYNLGGGKQNSVSVLEAIDAAQDACGKKLEWTYSDVARGGDHCVWYTDTGKFRSHYPNWDVKRDLGQIIEELCRQP